MLKFAIVYFYIFRKPVYAREIDGRFDVGGLESYLVCNGYFFEKHGQIDFS